MTPASPVPEKARSRRRDRHVVCHDMSHVCAQKAVEWLLEQDDLAKSEHDWASRTACTRYKQQPAAADKAVKNNILSKFAYSMCEESGSGRRSRHPSGSMQPKVPKATPKQAQACLLCSLVLLASSPMCHCHGVLISFAPAPTGHDAVVFWSSCCDELIGQYCAGTIS